MTTSALHHPPSTIRTPLPPPDTPLPAESPLRRLASRATPTQATPTQPPPPTPLRASADRPPPSRGFLTSRAATTNLERASLTSRATSRTFLSDPVALPDIPFEAPRPRAVETPFKDLIKPLTQIEKDPSDSGGFVSARDAPKPETTPAATPRKVNSQPPTPRGLSKETGKRPVYKIVKERTQIKKPEDSLNFAFKSTVSSTTKPAARLSQPRADSPQKFESPYSKVVAICTYRHSIMNKSRRFPFIAQTGNTCLQGCIST